MKGLAIYTIVAISIFLLGMLYNIANGDANGYTYITTAMLIPVMIFAIMYVGKAR